MKICILTHPLRNNYGGLLQAYALQKVLRGLGHDVVTDRFGACKPSGLCYKPIAFLYHFAKRYFLKNKLYNPWQYYFKSFNTSSHSYSKKVSIHTDRFVDKNIKTIDFFKQKHFPDKKTLEQFDAIVVGSDQVWRAAFFPYSTYFLDFTKNIDIIRVAYAASFAVDHWGEFSDALTQKCAESAKLFRGVSVREDSGIELCKKHLGIDAVQVLDPAFLLEREEYLELIEDGDKAENENILMVYTLDKSDEKSLIVKQVSTHLGLAPYEVMPKSKLAAKTACVNDCVFPSVSKWLSGFRDAKFVVTDSFHGTVFAIIFNKPFIVIANDYRGKSRFTSLLHIFSLENHLITSSDDLNNELFLPIDFDEVNTKKNVWKNKSFSFLSSNLVK